MDKTTTLPTANLSDTRMDDFWSNIDPGLTQPKPESRDLDVGVSDLARATGAGGLELVGGIGELARQAANYGRTQGGKDQGDYLENARANMAAKLAPALDVVAGVGGLAQSGADSLIDGMSADAKEAMSRSLVTETPQGNLELGDGIGDIDVWAMKMAQGVGSLLPTLLGGGVTGVAAKVTVGRMVTASMLKRGVSQEVAEAVAAKTVSRLATGAATTTGVTGSVGSAGVNAFDSVQAMSFDELSNSTTFRDAFHRIDGDPQLAHLSDSDKLAMAREETANLASQTTMGDAKTWGAAAVGTLMGDTMLFKMLAGKGAGSGVLKGIAKGAVGEGVSEALEEGAQQYIVNEALNEVAGTNINPMKGVVSAAIENGLIGIGVGGSTGGVSGLRGKHAQPAVDGREQAPMQEVPAHEQAEPVASAPDEATADPLSQPAQDSPLGPSSSQFDELRDVPAYLRQDDTADRFNGLAEDSEVQRALAGEFGPSVQELVAAQMQGGDQGKSLYERVQSGELGIDPFTGNKSVQQVAMENQRPALPLKDVIFAGDANAKPKGEEVAAPGDHDDHQAGAGPQFRGDERTRWQSGQEGDLLPPETATVRPAGELLGAVIEGEAREVGTELPHRDVVYGTDQRQPDTKPMRGSATESAIGPLQTLRITRKGKPFATEKEAAMASRKGQETPVPLNGGGFGVAAIEEVELAKGRIADLNKEQSHEQVAGVGPVSSEGQGDQQPAGEAVPALAGAEPETSSELPTPDRERGPAPDAVRDEGVHDDNALTTPAEAGVDVSGPVTAAEGQPAQQIEAARAEVAADPSDAQKEAGNYKKGHLKLHGLDIALENPKGSTRSGTDPDGKSWQSTMAHDYGYIKRTEGADGDHVDVFIGDKPESATVYVVDQVDPNTGKFDEHKVMMGFDSEQAARDGYLANYEKGWKGFGSIKAMPADEFKHWLKVGDTTKPVVKPAKQIRMSQQREGLSVDEAAKVVDDFLKDYNGNIPLEPFIREKASEIYGPSIEGTEFARTTKGAYHPSSDRIAIVSGNARPRDGRGADVSSSAPVRDALVQQPDNLRAGPSSAALSPQSDVDGRGGAGRAGQEAGGEVGRAGRGAGRAGAKADLLDTLRHEVLGHYGTDTFTPENKRALLQKLIDAKQQPWLAKEWARANQGYKHLDEIGRAEEVFASIAEKALPPRSIQAWGDIKTEFSRLLRKTGLAKGPIKEHELDSLIRAVGKGIRTGERTKQNIRGDHEVIGTPADEPASPGKPERIIRFSKQAQIKGEQPPAKHLTRKEAEMVTRGWLKQYRGVDGIDIQIHATQAEMEKALGLPPVDGLIRRAAFDRSESGLHVAANTITNPRHLREILRHEVLAHYGLANVLGGSHYTSLISKVISSQGNASMKGVWEWVQTHYGDEPAAVQAEEVIAHLAELEPSAWRRGWDKVVSWVTQALRAVGFAPEGITAAEIRSMIEALGKKLEVGSKESSSDLDGQWFSAARTPWKPGFPEVVLHGRLGDATAHPDYEAAKGGDDAAARRLVSDVLSKDAIRQLKGLIGDREAIALGVHAEEAVSRNAIPQAMADVLSKVLGMEVSVDIVQAAKVGRTAQDGFGRLANQPSFDGVVRTDKPYLIMDDTLTQGGTLANLKGYIEAHGGEVLAATALTGKQYSAKIAIDSSTLEQLRDQYDGTGLEAWWHDRFGYGFDSLTESEARYLLRAKDADKIRDRVTAAGYATPARSEHESTRDDGSLPPDGLKFSQAVAADEALQKLNLGRKPDIIDRTQERLSALRGTDRTAVKSWVDRFIKKANTEMLDALAPIKYAEDAAGITDARESGYIAARMASGAASTMQATMLYGLPEWKDGVIQRKAGTGESDALLGIFEGLGKDLHNWLGWMAGHRAEILMAEGRENLLTEQDIAALKSLDKGKESQFQEAKRKWNTLNASVLDLAEEAGLFSADDRAKWESEWYIPFFREGEDGDAMAPFKARGVANQSAGIKKLKGGTANTNDLLENIFTSTSKLIDASMKNMAAQKTVWNLADTGIIEVVARPNMMDWRALKNGKDLITVKLEGEDYMIRVEDPELYRAMTFFDRQPHGKLVRMAASAKRLLTAGVTASPEFMLRNFLRDSLSAWAISKDGFKPMIDSIRGIRKTMKMGGSTIDVMFSGASFLGGHLNGNDPQAMADSVRKALHRKGMTPPQIALYERSIIRNAKHAQEVLGKAWDQYSKYGEALENANREAVYDAAIKAGKSHAQAAFEARDLMDFSMLGASGAMQTLVMVLPFFNARAQGLGKLGRELRDNPRAIAKRAGMITAASLALLALNWDDERYEKLKDWEKDAYWHFWIGDDHWRMPKPFEIGILFGTIPERMARAMGDKDTGAQFGKAMARAFLETFALDPTPQLIKPMSEAYFNYDVFRGEAIENSADLSVLPEARYSEHTSLLMRELGQLTGFSPKKLEHIVVGYTGTIGSYVLAAADGLIRASQPGESASWRADEIPLIKAVYRGSGPEKSTQHMEQFYEMLGEVNELKRTVDQYRKAGMTKEAQALLDDQGGILKARKALTQTQLQVRQLRNRLDLIQRDKTLSGEEKRQRIDAIFAKRNDLVYRAVERTKGLWK